MPKFEIVQGPDAVKEEAPVKLWLEKFGTAVRLFASSLDVQAGAPFLLLTFHPSGQVISCAATPKSLGIDIDDWGQIKIQ